jgi:hypothetical protein
VAGEAAGHTGGSAALLAFVAEHERALTYDFRHRFQMPLSDIGSRIPFGEAIFLVEGLMREPSSHLAMTLRGWEWAAGFDDVALITLAEWYTNAHRDTKAAPDPFRFPRPWPDVDRVDVTAEERAVLERKLLERSALRDR